MALLWNNGPITTTAGTPYLSLSGHTTTTANNITIKPAPGEGFIDYLIANPSAPLAFSSNGVNFTLPSAAGGINYFNIQDANVITQGIQAQDPLSTSNSTIFSAGATCTLAQSIMDGYGQPGGAFIVNPSLSGASSSVFNLQNCLIVDRAASNSAATTFGASYNTAIANCTFVAINAPAAQSAVENTTAATGVTFTVVNSIFIGYTPLYVFTAANAGTIQESYGVFSAASISSGNVTVGTGNVYNATAAATFVNATTNFKILNTSSALNAGTTDTADIPPALDILGTTRPQGTAWDIGAYELPVPSSAFTGGGKGGGAAVSGVGSRAIATGGGHGGGQAFSGAAPNTATATGGGHGGGQAISTANAASARGGGQGGGQLYSQGAIDVAITLNPLGTQQVATPFTVTGTYTVTPSLQFSDDSTGTFTPIPASGVSPLGSTTFSFTNPGISTTGAHNVLVEDVSSDSAAAVNYTVAATTSGGGTTGGGGAPVTTGVASSLTALATIIPAYVYQEYNDDDNITAFFTAYNALAQGYLNWFNALNLPVWSSPAITGPLLDWVATGLYGIPRPTIALTQTLSTAGNYNTFNFNSLNFDGSSADSTTTLFVVTDDYYKRILTWTLYKGDGTAFNTLWLKRRVARFLAGVNGTDYTDTTEQISVQFTGTNTVNITIVNGPIPLTAATILQAAVLDGTLELPFQFSFTVLINTSVTVMNAANRINFSQVNESQYVALWGF